MNRLSVVLIASCAVLSACTQSTAPDTTAADETAIRASGNSWYKAFNSGDMDALASLYTDDAVVQAPNAPAARGSAAIRDFFTKQRADMQGAGLTVVEGARSDVGLAGDLAWQGDTYTVTDKSGATVESGKTLAVFQRKDGKWLMVRDTWNSDAPPAAANPAASAASAPR
ncbi:MAG TPA: nuclear transport factor 2 family protein [Steroidobacteraceae bacterium]|nr:nuclear transport factor 2 family protein [Steroidobacteraceae bacterium]